MWQSRVTWPFLAFSSFLISAPACSSWRMQPVEPASFVREQSPNTVRITRADSTTIVVHRPAVVGDSIIQLPRDSASPTPPGRPAVALPDVRGIAVRRFDPLKTLGLFGGVVFGAGIICAATSCLDFDMGWGS